MRNIPLIFCTSKNRAETERIRRQTENAHPFIVENGGAIFIPNDYFPKETEFTAAFPMKNERDDEYQIIELGVPYSNLREALSHIQAQFPGKIRGFGDLKIEEIAELSEMPQEEAALAKQREYDEPFVLDDDLLLDKIKKTAKISHLQITRGGRFYHLMGSNDKGIAAARLIRIYRQIFRTIKTVGLGDSINDRPFLAAVDIPILLPKKDGRHDPSVKLDGLILAKNAGPSGWHDEVLKIIQKF